jgi:hypothetical protein
MGGRVALLGITARRMTLALRLAAAAIVVGGAPAQLSPELLLLARIKQKTEQTLSHLPDYICLETIERWRKPSQSSSFRPTDTIRFEVAHVGGTELFAWPGASQLGEKSLSEMVGSGTIGTGAFSLCLRSVFGGTAPVFTYVGEERIGDRRAVRYDYRISVMNTPIQLRSGAGHGFAGESGSFWADPVSLEVIRILSKAEDIPPGLGIVSYVMDIYYGKVRIGDSDFLLPEKAEMVATLATGEVSRNMAGFADCRKYRSESVISFDKFPEPQATAVPASPPSAVTLPAGLRLETELLAEIDSAKAAVGDKIEARLRNEVRRDGQNLVPKGAVVQGRLVRLQRSAAAPAGVFIAIEFSELQFGTSRARFSADLQETSDLRGLRGGPSVTPRFGATVTTRIPAVSGGPGWATLLIDGSHVRVPKGFRMIWRTREDGQ